MSLLGTRPPKVFCVGQPDNERGRAVMVGKATGTDADMW